MSNIQFKAPNKNHLVPYLKHGVFYIYKAETEKYPEMVEVVKGPKWGRSIINKKYVALKFATLAIDTLTTEFKIEGGKKTAVADLEKEGFDAEASLELSDESL
jgi:hypothetical protein